MGSLMVLPSEEIRYTLPVRLSVSRLEEMDGVGDPNKDVAEDVEERIEVIMNRV